METDCLVHVFARLDLEDLAASAPLVCRGWRRAAADPSLWRALDLRRDHLARFMPWGPLAAAFARRYAVHRFSLAGFLRLCVSRARGSAEDVELPPLLADPADEIVHISLHCPRLRRLALPQLTAGDEARLPDLIPRWPLLEHLELGTKPSSFPALAAQLALHCPGFASLKTSGAVKPEDAAALARSLPALRSLCLDRSYLPREQLLAILAGCRDLREFCARGCVGFDDKDEEVLRRGARIQRFDVGGSKLVDDLEDEFAAGGGGFCDSSDVDVIVM
ncbi:F-box/LRR-repeat protein At3g48880-like [Miscanthus floridulus]|uniref:F-box/LRR-repeat protein At3g48880-like n=1 Tax=Miscanthus floridulus TaxID=154761 RepID=UPI00345A6EEE